MSPPAKTLADYMREYDEVQIASDERKEAILNARATLQAAEGIYDARVEDAHQAYEDALDALHEEINAAEVIGVQQGTLLDCILAEVRKLVDREE